QAGAPHGRRHRGREPAGQRLDLYHDPAAAPPAAHMRAGRPAAATILIVDDEPLNIDLLEQELADAGYRTHAVASGEAALDAAAREKPDLILLDVMMGGIDGYETCRRLKAAEATRAIPVIFLTALAYAFDKV